MPVRTETQAFRDQLKQRIKQYCRMHYKKTNISENVIRSDTVCMRENPFYVDTVRDFRDRRYEFKRAVKTWAAKMREA